MNFLIPLLLFVLAFVVILVFIVLIRKARQAYPTRRLEAENLGFHFQDPPDPGLVDRIVRLYTRRPSQKLALWRVFAKPLGETTLYLLDLEDTGGEDSSLLLDNALAIISPLLDLPEFGLFPRVAGEGFLTQAANRLIERLIGSHVSLVSFDDRPDFDRHYLVTGPDPESVRALLSEYIQDRLCAMEMIQIKAGGDTLTVANVAYTQKKPDERRNLEALYRQGLTIFDLLRRSTLE